MDLRTYLRDKAITQAETAIALGIDSSTLSLKLSGQRPWFGVEIKAVLSYLRTRTGEDVTFEQLFGSDAVADSRDGLPTVKE